MNIESSLNQLGINAITGVRILELLDISTDELQFPQRFAKVRDIIDFLKPLSEDTQRFFINKATRGKQIDKLQHFHEYIHLLKNKSSLTKQLDKVSNEKGLVEASGDIVKLQEILGREFDLQKEVNTLDSEINLYEK